jgi:23S rRNA pseudouridine2605 synthase
VPPSNAREPQRIAKLLARAGIASRREIERMIAEGRIALNGKTLETPATLLASLHGVTVDGNPVAAPAPARLFLFHKPPGVLTTERDPAGRRTIYDVLPKDLPRLVPVGRLDLNTEGLLLLTTDGELKRQLELPATGVERSYRARAYGPVTQEQLEELIEGVEIEGMRYGPIDANLERRTGANTWIEMTLTEGKNREVRRVLEHLGLEVSRLIRTRYGPFVLGDLAPGEIGEVRQHDLVAFRKTLKLPAGQRRYDPVAVGKAKPPPEPAPEAPSEARPPRSRPAPAKGAPRGARATDREAPAKPARAARARNFREASGETEAAPRRGRAPEPSRETRSGKPGTRSEPQPPRASDAKPRRAGAPRSDSPPEPRPSRAPDAKSRRAAPGDARPLRSPAGKPRRGPAPDKPQRPQGPRRK